MATSLSAFCIYTIKHHDLLADVAAGLIPPLFTDSVIFRSTIGTRV